MSAGAGTLPAFRFRNSFDFSGFRRSQSKTPSRNSVLVQRNGFETLAPFVTSWNADSFQGREFIPNSGAENCGAPRPPFSQIPPQGQPPGRRPAANGRIGRKLGEVAAGSVVSIQTRNTARSPPKHSFPGPVSMICPTPDPRRRFSKRCRHDSRSGADGVPDSGTQPQPGTVARLQPAALPGKAEDRQCRHAADDVSSPRNTGSRSFSRFPTRQAREQGFPG